MHNKKQILVLITCCCIVASSIGILTNASGVFFTPIAEDLGVGKGSVSMTLTIANIAYAIGGLLTVKLVHERNFKKMVLMLSVVYAVSTALLSLCSSIILLYILSAIRGISTGIVGFVMVSILINNHFDDGVGLATSIALGFSGIAGALLSPLLTIIINSIGWRMTYVLEAVLAFVLYLPCIVGPVSLNNKIKDVSDTSAPQQIEVKKISTATFMVVAIYAFCIAASTALPQHFPSMTIDATTGSLMVSIAMVVNTLSKIVLGAASDKIGVEKSLCVYGVFATIGLILLALFSSNSMAMLLAAGLVGLVYAMSAVGPVLMSQNLFKESYNAYYPKISLIGTVSNALFTTFVGFLYDLSGSYFSSIALIIGLTIIALVMILRALSLSTKQ